jgi:hypothetical protein
MCQSTITTVLGRVPMINHYYTTATIHKKWVKYTSINSNDCWARIPEKTRRSIHWATVTED